MELGHKENGMEITASDEGIIVRASLCNLLYEIFYQMEQEGINDLEDSLDIISEGNEITHSVHLKIRETKKK